jgi:hypothetical protein
MSDILRLGAPKPFEPPMEAYVLPRQRLGFLYVEETWMDKEGTIHQISAMSESYRHNCRMFLRRWAVRNVNAIYWAQALDDLLFIGMLNGEMALEMAERASEEEGQAILEDPESGIMQTPIYRALLNPQASILDWEV